VGDKLRADLSAGPLYLYVKSGLIFRGSIEVVAGDPDSVFIGYMGSDTMNVDRALRGTLVAPNGTIRLATLHDRREFVGSYFARDIEVQPDVTVRLQAFDYPWLEASCEDGLLNGFESDVDCGVGCLACFDGASCRFDQDCESTVCEGGSCNRPDCWEQPGSCQEGERCLTNGDCQLGLCPDGACRTIIIR
jgi:hypothetical protein